MMNNNEYFRIPFDSDECTSKGACSISPVNSALQELVMYILRVSVYYVLKLEGLNLENKNIKTEIINAIASLVTINEYGEKQMFYLVQRCIHIFQNIKCRYLAACKDNNIKQVMIAESFLPQNNVTLTESIMLGEKIKQFNYSSNIDRNLSEILFILQKSVCLNLSMLIDLNIFDNKSITDVFESINIFNTDNLSNDVSEHINILSSTDNLLQLSICQIIVQRYGKITKTKISRSSRKGKCILVSGSSLVDLEKILELTKDKNIDVYTHSNLLVSHAFPKFRQYKNLIGHYGYAAENCIVDFATFPGAILLTKNSGNTTEYLYRGKIFTKDYVPQQGITKINDDYSEIIDASLNKKGFKKGKILPDTELGYDEDEIIKSFNILKNDSERISHFFVIGTNAHSELQKNYFSAFFKKLKPDEYALSFYYGEESENIIKADIGNYSPLAASILSELLKDSRFKDKITFMFTNCEVNTFSRIVYLYNSGYRSFYMISCPPRLINPSVFKTFCDRYNIQITSKPDNDLKNIRGNTN